MSIFNQENNIFDLLYHLRECKILKQELDEVIDHLGTCEPFDTAVCGQIIETLESRELLNGFTGVVEHHLVPFLN